uniref:Uncharacterized protein n=1 Tax=Vitis vinifera TaxID=29760 RepID=A5AR02_VITVI|nr:hypothetical protein VITISV_003089 [Vitis vinifera]
MRKIWPLEDNCIKLRDNFAPCEIGTSTCEIKAYLAKWKWNTAAQSQRSPTCESDFATCQLGAQRAKMDSKLRNQLARFSQVTMQRAKSTCEMGYLCTNSFRSFLQIFFQPNSEDFSSEDERLGFLSLGVKKAGQHLVRQVISVHGDALVYLLRAFGRWFEGRIFLNSQYLVRFWIPWILIACNLAPWRSNCYLLFAFDGKSKVKDHLEWQVLGEKYESLQGASVRGI